MESSVAAGILARALNEGKLVAMVGSMASVTYEDPAGRTFKGLPSVSEILQVARNTFTYLTESEGFEDTFDKIQAYEGRARVESFLCTYYGNLPNVPTPPAQKLLSWLPFSGYITSNYDQFIETRLSEEGRSPHTLIENKDLVQLSPGQTPVIKYHGCVSRPSTIVACTNDYEELEQRRKLVRDYVSSSLAGKTLLVVGHGMRDSDLRRVLLELTEHLGELAPSIFLIRSPRNSEQNFSLGKITHKVIAEDLTQFLSRLEHTSLTLKGADANPISENVWLTSSFFSELRKASVLPSETQVIDAFLKRLRSEFSTRSDVLSVVDDAEIALEMTLQERPTYSALRRVWNEMETQLRSANSPQGAEVVVQNLIGERESNTARFSRIGADLFQSNERVLLFSQSQRVLQVLMGVPEALQRNIHLYVCECRPKSPRAYQDAAAICSALRDTAFRVTVCPDVVGMGLLATNQIDRVIMGTHAVYFEPGTDPANVIETGVAHSFVNTCGANALCLVAEEYSVPVHIIGEELKLEPVSVEDAPTHVHLHQEEDLEEQALSIRDLSTLAGEIGHINIGYDLIKMTEKTFLHLPV